MNHERFLLYSSVFVIMGLSNAVVPVLPELAATDQTTSVTSTSLLYSAFSPCYLSGFSVTGFAA